MATFRLYTILSRGGEVDDRVDSIQSDAQLKCKFDVPATEGVNEGIDFPSGCSADPIFNPIPIGNGNYAVIGEPLVIRVAGQADHIGPGIPGQLHGDGAYPAGGAGDDDRVTRAESDAPHRRVSRGAGHEQG